MSWSERLTEDSCGACVTGLVSADGCVAYFEVVLGVATGGEGSAALSEVPDVSFEWSDPVSFAAALGMCESRPWLSVWIIVAEAEVGRVLLLPVGVPSLAECEACVDGPCVCRLASGANWWTLVVRLDAEVDGTFPEMMCPGAASYDLAGAHWSAECSSKHGSSSAGSIPGSLPAAEASLGCCAYFA